MFLNPNVVGNYRHVAVRRTIIVRNRVDCYFFLRFFLCCNWLFREGFMLLEYFQGLLDDRVILVDVLSPSLLVQHVVDDSSVEYAFQELVTLANQEVSALQAMLVGISGELLHHVLFRQIVGQCHHFLEIVQFRTVVISISECILEYQTTHACFLEV